MTKVSCEIPERYVNPLFEVFDGGDFILSSYRDIEKPLTEMRIYFEDAAETGAAKKALADALEIVLGAAREGTRRTEDTAREGTRRTEDAAREGTRRTEDAAREDTRRTDGRAASMRPPQIIVETVPDEDWKFAYRRHFKTEQVSPRIFTVPEWEADEFFAGGRLAEGQIAIVSDPGLAFGTGKHETTKACLQYIDEILGGEAGSGGRETSDVRREAETSGARHEAETSDARREAEASDARRELPTTNYQLPTFLDMGTGSGILSIAAAKFGCPDVVGFDVDPDAVAAARENAAKNGVAARFEHFALGRAAGDAGGDLRLRFSPAGLVVANILGPLLIRFADEIVPYVKRRLVISGILTTLYPEVLAAYALRGFSEVSRKTIGEWTTGLLEYRKGTAQ